VPAKISCDPRSGEQVGEQWVVWAEAVFACISAARAHNEVVSDLCDNSGQGRGEGVRIQEGESILGGAVQTDQDHKGAPGQKVGLLGCVEGSKGRGQTRSGSAGGDTGSPACIRTEDEKRG
jgi:hypothetical protein